MTPAEILAAARKVLRKGFALLSGEISEHIEREFHARAVEVAAHLKVEGSVRGILDRASARYARDRAGELVKDFAKTTPEMLKATVARAIEEGWSTGRLRDELRENYAFSPDRALTIARTETSIARRAGGKVSAKACGAQSKHWDVSSGDACELCLENQAAGWIGIDEEFPNGDDPHPNCTCSVEYRFEPAEEDAGDEGDVE